MALQPVPRSIKYKGTKRGQDRKRKLILMILAIVVGVIIVAGVTVFLVLHFRQFKGYKVTSTIELTNSDQHIAYYPFLKGYVKVAGDGVTYFDKNGITWTESYEMSQPIADICGSYIVVADMKATDVYLFDESGLLNRITLSHSIIDVEVSKQGVIAVATDEKESNYIEIVDKTGNELITAKSVFSSSGYLSDIALCDDGSKLVATFISASAGYVESKVVFYDFSKSNAGEDMIVGGFNQYESIILTNVQFMEDNKVSVVGNSGFSIYDFSSTPQLIYEDLDFTWQIQSLFFDKKHIGLIVLDENIDNNYCIKVYNLKGKLEVDKGFDFAYNTAAFASSNVLLYASNDCEIYSFAGIKRFSYSFENRIAYMLSIGNEEKFIYAKADCTEFIKLK